MSGINLYPYQIDAIQRMKNGCILCGGVGSGKSRTALAYYYLQNGGKLNDRIYIRMDRNPSDLYIITTARKRDTHEWDFELIPFGLGGDSSISLYSNTVVIDSWNNITKYTDIKNSFFIFDEQRLVGSGVWVQSFLKIAKSNNWILLSATPGDTWSDYIPVFIANGFYKNRTDFTRNHVVYKQFRKFYQVDHYVNTGKLIRHRNDILVNMDYRKPTVPHDITIEVEYDHESYRFMTKNRWNVWNNMPIENASEFCQALRKIVNSSTDRINKIKDIYKEHPKVIIFYNYNYELDILKKIEYGQGVQVSEWNGHKHEPLPNNAKWVYLVQYSAGAEGWNCTDTDTIIFYSQNYSYKIMAQAKGRIDRLNTPYTDLYYYHLKSRAGIDLAIDRALRNKKKFNESRFYDRRN